ncbi:hypothetical protein [Castellaniella sp.]|uniref:hypothetical protein n=1 Tax=Castellaniella sp. TaxID=1955812 RepID=UPI002AFFB87B|nr:hypothetical protein [Castellaniella sp.]
MGKYFGGFTKDWSELVGSSTSGGTKALAGIKMLGKAVANVGTFAVTEVVPGLIESVGKSTEKNLEKNRSSMTDEQIAKSEEYIRRSNEIGAKRREARNVDWKISEIEEKIESLAEGDPRIEILKQDIEQLESTKPKWYAKEE